MKKAILVVSFGTTVPETRVANIDILEQEIAAAFPGVEVRRAFTSTMVRARIAAEEGLSIDPPAEALAKLAAERYDEVLIQPTHIIPGEEYEKLLDAIRPFWQDAAFPSIKMGRPLLCYEGREAGQPDDYRIAAAALKTQLPNSADEALRIILMGHGSGHFADRCYDLLQESIDREGLPVFVATVEGSRTFESAMEWLAQEHARRVALMPFMLVAGDHAINDMAGPEEDSWASRLQSAGYDVSSHLRGLGENPAFRSIYVDHLRAALPFGSEGTA